MSEQLADRAARLRQKVETDYPDPWDFKEIREIVGVVESLDRVDTDNGPKAVACIREVEGVAPKRYSVWLSQAALRNRFRDLDIRPGELVAIRYLGVGEASRPGYSPPHRFRVEVDRSQGGSGFDWGSIDGDEVGGRRIFAGGSQELLEDGRPVPGDDDIPF